MGTVRLTENELIDITRDEVGKYVADSFKATLYFTYNDMDQTFCVVMLPDPPRPFPSRVVVMAQVKDERIIILEDVTDKPLVDALTLNANVPREQITLAYQVAS